MNRVALYARVSSEIQEKEATIESQVAQLREAARKQDDIVIQEYRDDGFSGDLLARPAMDRLRDDAGKGLFERVLILSPDRLARKWVYGEVIAEELRKHGVTIQYLNQKDDGTEESKLLLGITGLFGQYEKAKIIERTRRGRLHSAKSGRILTSHPPYGYNYITKSAERPSRLEINEEQAAVVRLIFDLFGNRGTSVSDIGKELYGRSIASPLGNATWERSMLMKMLRSSTYIGVWHYNKTIAAQPRTIRKPNAIRRRLNTTEHVRPRDQWVAVHGVPAIVDPATFECAQKQLDKNRQFARRNRKRDYLLAGLARCAHCGRASGGTALKGGAYLYYRCMGTYRFGSLPAPCSSRGIPLKRVEDAVWSTLRRALENPRIFSQNIQAVQQDLATDYQSMMRERQEIAGQQDQLKSSETRLLDAYSAGAIEMEQLREQLDKLRQKREALNVRTSGTATEKTPQPVEYQAVEDYCRKVSRGLDLLERDFDERQKFLRSIVDKVVLEYGQATIMGALPAAASELPEPCHTLDVGTLPSRIRRTGRCRSRPR